MSRSICVVLTTRGNYAKMKSTMMAIGRDPRLQLQLVVGGALLSGDYGEFKALIERDGFRVDAVLDYIQAGTTPATVTASAGVCTRRFGEILERLQPDLVLVIADRYEALSIAQAALCMNIHIAHLEGGEVSGSIDERIRHAITKLAHIHFPANEDAAQRILRLGEYPASVHVVGTPSLDVLADLDLGNTGPLQAFLKEHGQGEYIDLRSDYIVVSQHPVVTEYAEAAEHFWSLAEAVRELATPTVWVLPNDDAGAGFVQPVLEALRKEPTAPPLCVLGSLPIHHYAVLLHHTRCLIGNTSSGIREGAFLGVPVVNIGNRQRGRQRSVNVIDVDYSSAAIVDAARRQVAHGPYARDPIYGDGHAGEKIAEVLAGLLPELDKSIVY